MREPKLDKKEAYERMIKHYNIEGNDAWKNRDMKKVKQYAEIVKMYQRLAAIEKKYD